MILYPGGVDPDPTFKNDLEPNVKIKTGPDPTGFGSATLVTSQGQIQFIPLTIKTNIKHLNFKISMKKREKKIRK